MLNSSRRNWMLGTLGEAVAARSEAAVNEADDLAVLTLRTGLGPDPVEKGLPGGVDRSLSCAYHSLQPENQCLDHSVARAGDCPGKGAGRRASGGQVHGVPLGLKDTIDTVGTRTTAGAAIYQYRFPTEDAEVTRRLKSAGAVLIGKCNMHIFAQGATSAVSYFGPVRNPWNLELIAGGSSGGSAAAVAMNHCYAALGTDTGGSIRTPSAMCGVVGFKPTYGRVSIRGIVPLTWSLDHCGPIAGTVEDTALVLQQIAGYDRFDLQSLDAPVPDYSKAFAARVAQMRIGIPPMFFDGLDPEVAEAVEKALSVMNRIAKGSREIEVPNVLGTGAGSEGAVYRENLGNSFIS